MAGAWMIKKVIFEWTKIFYHEHMQAYPNRFNTENMISVCSSMPNLLFTYLSVSFLAHWSKDTAGGPWRAGRNVKKLFFDIESGAMPKTGNTYWRGRISTVDLLVLSSSDKLLLIVNIRFYLLQNNKEVNCNDPTPSVRAPCLRDTTTILIKTLVYWLYL